MFNTSTMTQAPEIGTCHLLRLNPQRKRPPRRRSFVINLNISSLALLTLVMILQNDNCATNQVAAINSVLNLNKTFPYLINSTTGQVIEPRDYMDFENIYAPDEAYKARQSAQGKNYHRFKAFDFANYFQSDYWHYSSPEDLRQSAMPVANATSCARQLSWLHAKLGADEAAREHLFKPGEQHANLVALVDAFGRPEAGTYFGRSYWLGSHYQCSRLSLQMRKFELEERCHKRLQANKSSITMEQCLAVEASGTAMAERATADDDVKFRYCIGKAHDIDWPSTKQDNYNPRISYKIGLCLPESCETLSFGRHADQLQRLMELNMPDYTRNRIRLHELYCLPDERSPIRALPLASRLFLCLCMAWLCLLLIATFVYSFHKRQQRRLAHILANSQCQNGKLLVANGCDFGLEATGEQRRENELETEDQQLTRSCCCLYRQKLLEIGEEGHCLCSVQGAECEFSKRHQEDTSPANSKACSLSTFGEDHDEAEEGEDGDPKKPPPERRTLHADPSNNIMNNNNHLVVNSCTNKSLHQLNQSASTLTRSLSSGSLADWLRESPMALRILQAMSIKETLREFQQPPQVLRVRGAVRKLRVNLNALDSIKCLCCILVIFGHVIFIHMQHLSNIEHTIELSNEIYPRALMSFFNFVDTFFIISGLLTTYFIFKRFNKRTLASPRVWFYISFMRLLRLSPVYLLVFWYIKLLSVYLQVGPIWDYGTDSESIKGLCINDHWWKSLLYLGNWNTMQPLCILPAWSIIVDAQYSLFVPPLLFLIFKHKRLGYATLLMGILISTAKMSFQLANQTAVKTSDMAKIRLHVYPLISRFAAEFYNTAWNRIGPVAIGICGGHMLYLYERGSIRRWPWFMRGLSFKLVLLLHMLIFALPAIGLITDDPRKRASPQEYNEENTIIFIITNATIKPIWSLINTIFLLRLITDLRAHSVMARLMSHNIWHCMGKLCFTSYLIHYEIILTLLKSRQEGLIDPNWSNALREFSAAFLISTLISYFIYILYEAPINKLIMLAFEGKSNQLKRATETTVNGSPTINASVPANKTDNARTEDAQHKRLDGQLQHQYVTAMAAADTDNDRNGHPLHLRSIRGGGSQGSLENTHSNTTNGFNIELEAKQPFKDHTNTQQDSNQMLNQLLQQQQQNERVASFA